MDKSLFPTFMCLHGIDNIFMLFFWFLIGLYVYTIRYREKNAIKHEKKRVAINLDTAFSLKSR